MFIVIKSRSRPDNCLILPRSITYALNGGNNRRLGPARVGKFFSVQLLEGKCRVVWKCLHPFDCKSTGSKFYREDVGSIRFRGQQQQHWCEVIKETSGLSGYV